MSSAVIIGATGLVGSHILTTLLASDAWTAVSSIGRRAPPGVTSPKLTATAETDSAEWAGKLTSSSPPADAMFAALGTTRADAGGIANQWKIDHDLNIEMAEAAKKAGVKTYIFISSSGTRGVVGSRLPYSQMKNGVEDKLKELDFETCIVLKPGLLLGDRDKPKTPVFNSIAHAMGKLHAALQDSWAVEGEEVAKAAVRAAEMAIAGKAPSKYWVIEQAEIIKLARMEGAI